MKKTFILLVFVFSLVAGTILVQAGGAGKAADIKRCIKDNQGEGQTLSTVKKYCECMYEEWPDGDPTKTITQWEKTKAGRVAEKKCEKISGWKK